MSDYNYLCRHANIPAFGRILPLFTPFPTILRGIHEIPLLQILRNGNNRPDNYSTWHLQQQLSRTKVSEKLPVRQLSVNCYMHGEAVLSGEPMTADLQHLNSL
jgi:hypothetical protein